MPTIKRGRWYDLYVRQLPQPQYRYEDKEVFSLPVSSPEPTTKCVGDAFLMTQSPETVPPGLEKEPANDEEDSQPLDTPYSRRHRSVASLSLHASPQSSVERSDSPPPLRRQRNVTSSSPTRQPRRRPRSYISHRRRTWSHLLEKKQ